MVRDLTTAARLERGHARDLADLQAMLNRGLVDAQAVRDAFAAIEPELIRYPALDAEVLAEKVTDALASSSGTARDDG